MRFSEDPHPGSPVEWADNWLSNALARASKVVTPRWCQEPDHWTSKLTKVLYTDCPCCMLFRGIVVGAAAMLAVVLAALAITPLLA